MEEDRRLRDGEDGFDPRSLFKDNRWGVVLADAGGVAVREANPMACGLLRRKRRDLVGGEADFFDPSDGRLAPAREEQRRAGRFEGVLRLLRGDGTSFEAEVTVASYAVEEEGEAGNKDGLCIVFQDVVPRKARDPGEWDSSPMRYASDIVVVLDADGSMRYVSPSTERVLGYKPEDLVGAVMLDVIHPDDFEGVVGAFAEVWDTPGVSPPIHFRARHRDGSWLQVELGTNNLLDDAGVRGVVIVGRDVTERVRAEEETRCRNEELERRVAERTRKLEALVEELRENERTLRESEERFRKLNEAIFDGVTVNEPGKVLESNETFARMFGYEPEEVVGMSGLDFAAPESRDLVLQKFESGAWESYEAVGQKKDGTRIIVEVRGRPSNYRGRPVRLTAIRDVTELRDKERVLRESEERFRMTFEQAAVGIAHVGLDGRWLRVNPKLCETVGYACGDLLSKTFQEVTHPEDLDADLEQVRRLLAGEIDGYSIDKRYVKKDGSHVWINLRVSLVRESSGAPSYFISVVEDIDERKKAELALRFLTPREKEVLMLLAEGYTNPRIAEHLAISARTAKFHVQNVIEKLGAADRKQAAERVSELGLPPHAGGGNGA